LITAGGSHKTKQANALQREKKESRKNKGGRKKRGGRGEVGKKMGWREESDTWSGSFS